MNETELTTTFSAENIKPYSGLIIVIIGVFLLLAAIFNWDFVFKDKANSFNSQKIAGWVNLFGRNTTRVFVGLSALLVIILGLIWFWYDMTHR